MVSGVRSQFERVAPTKKVMSARRMALRNWDFSTDEDVDRTSLAVVQRGMFQLRATEETRRPHRSGDFRSSAARKSSHMEDCAISRTSARSLRLSSISLCGTNEERMRALVAVLEFMPGTQILRDIP